MIDIDSQDRAVQIGKGLAVPFRIILGTGISGSYVEIAVGTKGDHAPPVEIGRLVNLEDHP